jgi:thymidylate synthase (FAD)
MDKQCAEEISHDIISFGADVEPKPGKNKRQTTRETTDLQPRQLPNMGARRMSLDNLRTRSPSDNGLVSVGTDHIEVALVQDFSDSDLNYMSRLAQSSGSGAPPEMVRQKDAEEFLTGGLAYQSLEDFRIAFAVRGVSRVCTHQLVRTRAAAFKQQSQQDTWQGDMPEFRMPESVWINPVVRREWIAHIIDAARVYNMAIQADIMYKDARYILPEGTANFILCEYSLRTFLEMYAYRACVMFQEELVYVTREMGRLLIESHPYLEPFIKISCERIHRCTFQGPERVEETCTFPWAKEDNRVYRQMRSGFAS